MESEQQHHLISKVVRSRFDTAMNIETNLRGRLRNTTLPKSKGLLPLFEALINSIHALEEAQIPPEQGLIRVVIERASTLFDADTDGRSQGRPATRKIVSFHVIDNGVGFNEANFDSFRTLDTDYKATKGGRGIGRLLWLKAFSRVDVVSRFLNDSEELTQRSFSFTPNGVTDDAVEAAADAAQRETAIHLVGFDPRYRAHSRKTSNAIAKAMVEHCLWYFVRPGGAPRIIVEDQGEEILLDDLFEAHMRSSATPDRIEVKGHRFDLLHVQLRASASAVHSIAYCADDRLVMEEKLAGHIPGLRGPLGDSEDGFVYMCYVSSDLLSDQVRPERNAFEIPTDSGGLFEDTEVGWNDIRSGVISRAAEHLVVHLDQVREHARDRIHDFVSTKAPRYRPILGHLAPNALDIDPEISDNELELTLHREFVGLEEQLLTEGNALMELQSGESADDYSARIESYLQKVEDIKKSDLANYVTHRRVVIDLLAAAIERRPDGRYVREDFIHTLIMPMRTDSTEVLLDNCNLWLVDERLAFHDYLASDTPLSRMPVTGSSSTLEPDLVALNVFDNPILVADSPTPPLASLVVIELKRPMRNDAAEGRERDPIEQAIEYLGRIRQGNVQTAQGRPIPASEDIPGFCYVICDLTPSVVKRCKMHDLTRTSDGMGYFAYKKSYEAYIEVISFGRLVNMAQERNRAFFDKLGLPAS